MRYTIGEGYLFIHFGFASVSAVPQMFNRVYVDEEMPNKISLKLLTCKEHHKVSNGYTDEEKYDGFILEDIITKEIWHNEHPFASLTDNGSSMVNLDITVEQMEEMEVIEMYDAMRLLSDLFRAISREDNGDKQRKLKNHYIDIIKEIKAFGYSVKRNQKIWKHLDDDRVTIVPGVTKHTFKKI